MPLQFNKKPPNTHRHHHQKKKALQQYLNPSPSSSLSTGETCLHTAASHGHPDLVSLLMQLGSDLDAQESLAGRTALHLAIERGRAEAALRLARQPGANLDATTYSGCTAYQLASCLDERLARELLRLGATGPENLTGGFRFCGGAVGLTAS